MTVRDHLPRGSARAGQSKMEYHIIQTGLQDLQHLLAGNAAPLEGPLVNAAKLPLEQTIIITELLLLDQPQGIIRMFAARFRAMHSGTVIAALQIFGRAENRNAKTPADANSRTCITSHNYNL